MVSLMCVTDDVHTCWVTYHYIRLLLPKIPLHATRRNFSQLEKWSFTVQESKIMGMTVTLEEHCGKNAHSRYYPIKL